MSVVVFDLDFTLVDDEPRLFPNVRNIIEKLSLKYKLAIASYNSKAKYILARYDLVKYFDIIVSLQHFTKQIHFTTIKKHFNIEYSDMIFFDDDIKNIELAKTLGIKSTLVDYQTGVTLNDIKDL
jgi:HAD superfamily hydrolase (TIGR01509 family)